MSGGPARMVAPRTAARSYARLDRLRAPVSTAYVIPAYVPSSARGASPLHRGARPAARRRPRRGQAVDLSAPDRHRRRAPRRRRRRRRRGRPALVLVVLAGVGVHPVPGPPTPPLYFCNADEVGQRAELHGDKRFRVQGTVDDGSDSRVDAGTSPSRVSYNGATIPVHYQRRARRHLPGGDARRGRGPDGRTATFAGDRILVKHTEQYTGREPGPGSRTRRDGPPDERRARHRRRQPGPRRVVLGFLTLVVGLVPHRPQPAADRARIYVWLVLVGAVLAFAAMERALITRDFSLAYVATGRLARPRRRSTTSPRCGARSRARSCCGRSSSPATSWPSPSAVPRAGWTTRSWLGAGDAVRHLRLLLPAAVRAGQPVQARWRAPSRPTAPAPTRCCRTTR